MEVEPWDIQIIQHFSLVHSFKATQAARLQIMPNPSANTTLEQFREALVLKAFYHATNCIMF